jgi:hypothetical protein
MCRQISIIYLSNTTYIQRLVKISTDVNFVYVDSSSGEKIIQIKHRYSGFRLIIIYRKKNRIINDSLNITQLRIQGLR